MSARLVEADITSANYAASSPQLGAPSIGGNLGLRSIDHFGHFSRIDPQPCSLQMIDIALFTLSLQKTTRPNSGRNRINMRGSGLCCAIGVS